MILMLRTIETSALHFQREKGREGEREGREIGTEREREKSVLILANLMDRKYGGQVGIEGQL